MWRLERVIGWRAKSSGMLRYVFLLYVYVSSSFQLAFFYYPDRGFSVLFPQLEDKCQDKPRKDGARPALF